MNIITKIDNLEPGVIDPFTNFKVNYTRKKRNFLLTHLFAKKESVRIHKIS